MRRPSTITATDMRRINRSAILEIVRRESPISRTLIAEKLGVSLPTVMRIIDELVESSLVRTTDSTEWSGGRRRPLLEFNAEGHAVVGIDLSGSKIFGAIADLGGTILDEAEVNRHGLSGEETYDRLVELIDLLIASPKLGERKMMGIGVGAPGVTLHTKGIVTWAPSLNWNHYPLRDKLATKFSVPIVVENDVNMAALGELWFGAGQNLHNMVLITISTGIGSGIIVDGMLYRGANNAAGEVGYLLPGREFLGKQYSTFGALEEVAAGAGITERARQLLKDQRDPAALARLSIEDVFEAARRGEVWACSVIDDAVEYLAIMIASVSAYFDPGLIVLGGAVVQYADQFVESILKRIEGTTPIPSQVVASVLGHRATALGAVINILQYVVDAYVVHKLR